MKPLKNILICVLMVTLVTACGPKTVEAFVFEGSNPYVPQAGDGDLMAGEITVDSASVFLMASQPPQLIVNFSYFQPTPCHQLRVEVSGPDDKNQINLKAYAVAEKDKPCTLMSLATPLPASLSFGSLPRGHYFVILNGNQIGEFDV